MCILEYFKSFNLVFARLHRFANMHGTNLLISKTKQNKHQFLLEFLWVISTVQNGIQSIYYVWTCIFLVNISITFHLSWTWEYSIWLARMPFSLLTEMQIYGIDSVWQHSNEQFHMIKSMSAVVTLRLTIEFIKRTISCQTLWK